MAKNLEEIARRIRLQIVEMAYQAGSERRGHPGPALSITDIVVALFFHVMRIDRKNPHWPERDRFILSKGHASMLLYSILAERGFFPHETLKTFRHVDSILQGHPDMRKTPGVDMTTGSLGHGLSAGVGMALAGKIDRRDYHVFVVLGDGEIQEGLVWEAAMAASHYRLDHLVAIIDCNRWQSCGRVEDTISPGPLLEKWCSFGWNVLEIDGHSMPEILSALELAVRHRSSPTVIIAHTTKGKGISYMEDDNSWHQKAPTLEQLEIARRELMSQGEA